MPTYFEQGFFVREPAWHGLGVVLDDYPGREQAMQLAGHDFDIVESAIADLTLAPAAVAPADDFSWLVSGAPAPVAEPVPTWTEIEGWKAHRRSDTGALIHVSRDTFERIPNSVAYDFAEALMDQGFKYETGITLKGGAVCALTLFLDEPITLPGDDSITLPYIGESWAHDGSAALRVRSTSVRQVCANTVAASEAEGERLGTDISIRHTKNWRERVDEARQVVTGTRQAFETYTEVMTALGECYVTPAQRDLFCSAIPTNVSLRALQTFERAAKTDRVQLNYNEARQLVRSVFDGPTIPDAHRFTAYGLHLAGTEYLDHLRGYRDQGSYVGRTLLRDEPLKARLRSLIDDVLVNA